MKRYSRFILVLAVMIGVVFALSTYVSMANAAAPASVTIDKIKKAKPAVTFPHKAHEERLAGKCADCHATAAGGGASTLKTMADFHKQCKDCHASNKGPTDCASCHK